ncbi:heat-inducible transcriptional repressor HrcA [Myxococcota bacterium]|nr:heat-inducible transcriptional repressor HrcA [Myxococcota bacterium]
MAAQEPSGNLQKYSLSDRQAAVLRAMVNAHVGEASPIGSGTISHLIPVHLSSASVRNTLAELAEMGLIERPHKSSGSVPTDSGLRVYVDQLLDDHDVAPYERRTIAYGVEEAEADSVVTVASQLLSERTRLLGFVVAPRLERLVLQHVSLVRLSRERLLVVFISQNGTPHRRVITDDWALSQSELDAIAAALNERVVGRTLPQVRSLLMREAEGLRVRADRLLSRVVELGARALVSSVDEPEPVDLVIATRLALLKQPEFHDTERVRSLFEALEMKERLLEVLEGMMEDQGVQVAFGDEVDEPGLRHCALVACSYGREGESPLGTLGVIGPSRIDYERVIPLVGFFSQVVAEKLQA